MTSPAKPPPRCRDCNWPLTNRTSDRCWDCYVAWNRGSGQPVPEPVDDEPDWVVVDRLMSGVPVTSTAAERAEAVRRMTATGLPVDVIAARMHCSERLVVRWRARVAS